MTVISSSSAQSVLSDPSLVFETLDLAPAVDALIDRAFGPGRFAKVSERLREGNHQLADCSFVAVRDGAPVGAVRMWPVTIGDKPVAFLGPLAVDADQRSAGLGQALVEQACQAAAAAGWSAVLLVGDAPYFSRAGFAVAPGVVMPGPVDARRVLLRALRPGGADDLSGLVAIA
jgi:predicted N-acetyltransferase YhbS